MTRALGLVFVLAVACAFSIPLLASSTAPLQTATCNFDTNKQLAVEYEPITVDVKKLVFGHEIPYDKAWAPGGKPMTLFLTAPVTIGHTELPTGAYTMFVIPSEKQWTLAISKSTDTSGHYDKAQDLVRVPMEYGQLMHPEDEFTIYFAHVAADQCSMRLDLDQSRAWVIFQKK